MLSSPLPGWYPAPTSLSFFLRHIVQKASNAPSKATIEPVYAVLANCDLRFLDVFPPKIIISLQEQLNTILRTSLNDHSTSVLCLAIFAKLSTIAFPLKDHAWSSDGPDSSVGSDSSNQDDKFRIARKYFIKGASDKVSKIMDLVILHAVQACKPTPDPTQAAERLKISADILNAIESEERNSWVQKKKSAPTILKLYSELMRPHISREVQIAGFAVIAALNISSVPQDLILACEKALEGSSLPQGFQIDTILASFACKFSSSFIQEKLLHMLLLASRRCQYSVEVSHELQHARTFARALAKVLRTSPTLRQSVLVALNSNGLCGALHDFIMPTDFGNFPAHGNQPVCPNSVEEIKRSLQLELSALFLRAAIHALPDEIGIDSSLAEALLSRASDPPSSIPECKCFVPPPIATADSLSLYQVCSTPVSSAVGHGWRNQLEKELKRKAAHEYESILATVNQVCQDFENRCNEVEEPLRREEAKSKELQSRFETLDLHCRDLENEAQERALILDGLEAEKSSLADQLDSSRQQTSRISQNYTQLQQKHDRSMAEMASAAKSSLETTKQQELELQASLIAKNEEVEQLGQRLAVLESETKRLELRNSKVSEDLVQRNSEVAKAEAKYNSYQEEISRLLEKFQDQRLMNESVLSKREAELSQARQHANQRQDEINRLLQLDVDQKETVSRIKQDIIELQRNLDNTIAVNNQASMKQTANHEQIVSELQDELASYKVEAQCETKKLRRTIEELSRKCERRTKEAAEAQAVTNNMRTLLNYTTEPRVDFDATCKRTSASDFQGSSASSSSTRSGPTPKRSKLRRGPKTPNIQQPKITVGHKSVKPFSDLDSKCKRPQPLAELPLMTQSNSPTPRVEGKMIMGDENEPLGTNVLGELSFADSDILTSTNPRGVDELQHNTRRDVYDETTADF